MALFLNLKFVGATINMGQRINIIDYGQTVFMCVLLRKILYKAQSQMILLKSVEDMGIDDSSISVDYRECNFGTCTCITQPSALNVESIYFRSILCSKFDMAEYNKFVHFYLKSVS